MITILLIDHDIDSEMEIVTILGEQDCQNFEIISAPSYACLDDILEDVRGDYVWILPPMHSPAQTQTIKKINSLLHVHAPDVIAGHFVYNEGTRKKFGRRRIEKNFSIMPLSAFMWSTHFLKKLDGDILCETLTRDAYSSVRTILKANFPVTITPDFIDETKFLHSKTTQKFQNSIKGQFIILLKHFMRDGLCV